MDEAAVDADRSVKVRLRLSRVGTIEVSSAALDRGAPEPVRLAIDDVPVDPADLFLFHKTTLRRRYEEAEVRHPDADDIDPHQHPREITETSVANVAAKLDGRGDAATRRGPPSRDASEPRSADGDARGGVIRVDDFGRPRSSPAGARCAGGDARCWWTERSGAGS